MSQKDKNQEHSEYPARPTVGQPDDMSIPFFAYGIFRHDEIAWPRIKKYVSSNSNSKINDWVIRLRNGLPVLISQNGASVEGDCVEFSNSQAAYELIGSTEPSGEYKWKTLLTQEKVECNVLVAEKPQRGISDEPLSSWTSANDPSFVHGMAAVALTVNEVRGLLSVNKPWSDSPEDWNAFFRLQGAYLVLWSIVERLATFRFGAEFVSLSKESGNVTAKIYELATELAFQDAMKKADIRDIKVVSVRENRPKKIVNGLISDGDQTEKTEKVLKTWYQVRSNITHRGKSAHSDNEMVLQATIDLFNVMYFYLMETIQGMNDQWKPRGVSVLPHQTDKRQD